MLDAYDQELIAGFEAETKSYLPTIREGIDLFHEDGLATAKFEEAARYAHTIKGAAAMVGLHPLSHIARFLDAGFKALRFGSLRPTADTHRVMHDNVDMLAGYFVAMANQSVDDIALLSEVTQAYRAIGIVDPGKLGGYGSKPAGPPKQTNLTAELSDIFELEAEDHLTQINRGLAILEEEPNRRDVLQQIRRSTHTLKGASSLVGKERVTQFSHRMEDLLDLLYEGQLVIDKETLDLLFQSSDALHNLIKGTTAKYAESLMDQLSQRYKALLDASPPPSLDTVLGVQVEIEAPQPAPVDESESQLPAATEETTEEGEPISHLQVAAVDTIEIEEPLQPHEENEPALPLASQQPVALPEPVASPPVVTNLRPKKSPSRPPFQLQPSPKIASTNEELAADTIVRIPIQRLDELVRLISELTISRAALEQRIATMTNTIGELQPSVTRLRRISGQLDTEYEAVALNRSNPPTKSGEPVRPFSEPADGVSPGSYGFDELEFDRYTDFHLMTRGVAETSSDLRTIDAELRTLFGDVQSILTRQESLSSSLQEQLLRIRMVPLSQITGRLQRVIRSVARHSNKEVTLTVEGGDIEVDKGVLQQLTDPLLHLLRNAVDHGVEPKEVRSAAGKSEVANITLRASQEGSRIIVSITDDGRGIDLGQIRQQAIERDYVDQESVDELSDNELFDLLFAPGFSTANQLTEISGRGVGLDVVGSSVARLKGHVDVNSTLGKGTTFTIELPTTLAVMEALRVEVNGERFALPLRAIKRIVHVAPDAFELVNREEIIRLGGDIYPLIRLAKVLNLPESRETTSDSLPLLILNVEGQRPAALVVDDIFQGNEIVVKSLGNHLRTLRYLSGATVMGDGTVVLILNPEELIRLGTQQEQLAADSSTTHVQKSGLQILIVDDSVSVRRVNAGIVSKAGWEPIIARDGQEALEMLQSDQVQPDAILLDIEMPRMDGYQLSATLRSLEKFRELPIIMITSRAGAKHRRKADEVGANAYLVKPYQQTELIATVERLCLEPAGIFPSTHSN